LVVFACDIDSSGAMVIWIIILIIIYVDNTIFCQLFIN
jgi:hypothetical protein